MTEDEEKFYVSKAMRTFGGSFVKALGEALMCADFINVKKIKQTWPEYWKQYLKMSKSIPKEDIE